MAYDINIDSTSSCAPTSQTKVEVIGTTIKITFTDGSTREHSLPTPPSVDLSGYALKEHKHSVADIEDFPTLPTKTSELTNDSGFITASSIPTVPDLTEFEQHLSDTSNPHGVTKGQVGLGSVDNTSDANKPVSTAQQTAIKAAENAAKSHANTIVANKVEKVEGSRLMSNEEGDKLAKFDEKHYRPPVLTVEALTAIPEAELYDRERRYVDSEKKDYFYDADATSGDLAPDNQTGGIGFWMTSSADSGETYGQWNLNVAGAFKKAMVSNKILDLRAAGLISVSYTEEGIVTYSTSATKNATDAQLRDRSTHTGTQDISTVTGLQTTLDNKIKSSTQAEIDAMNADSSWIPGTLYVVPC